MSSSLDGRRTNLEMGLRNTDFGVKTETEHQFFYYLVHIIIALGFGVVQVHQEPRVCEERSQDPVQGGEDERNRSGYPGEGSQHFSFSFLDL